MSVSKRRFSVTFTTAYISRLKRLVAEGLYIDDQDAIRHAMRRLFDHHGIPLMPEEASGW